MYYYVDAVACSDAYVTASVATPQVVGVAFNSTTHRHEATFSVSASVVQTNGQPFPSNATFTYSWSAGSGGAPLEFADRTAASTTAVAVGPSYCLPTCEVVVQYNGQTWYGKSSAQCAAIGGPIKTVIKHPTSQYSVTYDHDANDPTKPFYLTYLNYSHTDTIDSNTQETQKVYMSVAYPQKYCVAKFDPIPNVFFSSPDAAGMAKKLCWAEGVFKNAVPKAHFHYDYNGLVGDADDDSATTQDLVTDPSTGATTWVPHVYAFSSHAPTRLVDVNDPIVRPANGNPNDPQTLSPNNPIAQPQPSGLTYWTDLHVYRCSLLDQDDARMPGIWVQERFTDGNRLGLTVNQTNTTYWPTLLFAVLNSGHIDARDGMFGAADATAAGNPKIYDFLYYPWPGTTAMEENTDHAYYAGSRDAAGSLTTGVFLGTYTIKFTPGSQPNTMGTASQSLTKAP